MRNPASFCNVVGLRTSAGRVPTWPSEVGWYTISVQGPMARTAEDVALMLSTIAGPDRRSPIAIAEPGSLFARPLERDFSGVKIAWSRDLGGLPVDSAVTSVMEAQRPVLEQLGCVIHDGAPDFTDADEIFKVWRAWRFELKFADLLQSHPDQIKETIIWNAEEGKKLTGPQIARAEVKRTQLYHRVRTFMETYEFLVLPVSQVPPFDIRQRHVSEIDGEPMETYIDWMRTCYYITVTGLPANVSLTSSCPSRRATGYARASPPAT